MGFRILFTFERNETQAKETQAQIIDSGGKCEMLQFDVSDTEASQAALGGWLQANTSARIDVLVNNAGIRRDNLLLWQTQEDWHRVLAVTLDGFYNITPLILKRMAAQRYGRIVNMASVSGLKGMAGQTNYSAAKGGLIAATKALAQEVARRNITVNAIAPGFIETDMTKELSNAQIRELIPMRRFGTAEEVANAVAFFASEESSYITGQVLSINGGIFT